MKSEICYELEDPKITKLFSGDPKMAKMRMTPKKNLSREEQEFIERDNKKRLGASNSEKTLSKKSDLLSASLKVKQRSRST